MLNYFDICDKIAPFLACRLIARAALKETAWRDHVYVPCGCYCCTVSPFSLNTPISSDLAESTTNFYLRNKALVKKRNNWIVFTFCK